MPRNALSDVLEGASPSAWVAAVRKPAVPASRWPVRWNNYCLQFSTGESKHICNSSLHEWMLWRTFNVFTDVTLAVF
jgi:hypothetical protein